MYKFTQYDKTTIKPECSNNTKNFMYYKIAVLTTFSKNDGRRKCLSHLIPHREFGFLKKFTIIRKRVMPMFM